MEVHLLSQHSGTWRIRFADQLREKRAVMNHRLPQVFRARLPLRMTKRNFVPCPVMLHHPWMLHGDVSGALVEVADRVAALAHYVTQCLDRF